MEKKRQIAAVLILLALIGVIAYRHSTGKDLEKYEASFFDVFDTQTQIIGYASSKEQFSEQMSLIKDKFQYYNDLYDIYHDYEGMNNIKTINDNAGIQPVKVDEEIIELLKLGITMDEKTDGNMNIAMGSVLSIWHDYREAGSEDPDSAELPPMDELERAAEHTDIHDIVIDEEASTVYLTDPDMSLDVGSIGKGYAVQKVAEYAKNELGIQYMLFSVGGNVCAIGGHPDGSAWAVGVEDLISIGTIGLIKGINTFNPDKNIKLATYASRCIENEILMYLRRNSKTKLEVSIDEPLNVDWDGNELLLSDILGTDEDVVGKDMETDVERKLLKTAIEKLSGRERMIIELRFGLNTSDGEEKTQKEVADMLGISQSYISRLEKKIMGRLKKEIVRFE